MKKKLKKYGGDAWLEYFDDPEYLGSQQLIKAAKQILEKNRMNKVIFEFVVFDW